jgi:trans-aconitate 2-methyltransferase
MSKSGQGWDASLYESDHAFVWKYGADLLPLLDPKSGERILDLGCGTGHLTAEIAMTGAQTLGIDSSPNMIGQARQNYPKLKFQLADARTFETDQPFDAVFSNAALHWVLEPRAAAQRIHQALKPGGRFVAEFGGKGNNAQVIAALREAGAGDPLASFYFPSISEYATLLELEGFEVRFATLFDRFTELPDPVRGLEQWLLMFQQKSLSAIPHPSLSPALRQIEDKLRPALFRDGHWHIDYRRIRISAYRLP